MFLNKHIRNRNGQIYEKKHINVTILYALYLMLMLHFTSFYMVIILSTIESRTIQVNGTIIISTSIPTKYVLKYEY